MIVKDFPGPEITLVPLQGVIIEPSEPPPPMTGEFVLEAVQRHCGKDSWSNEKISIELHNGILIVSQTEDVHRQIRNLLNKLRANK
jgi:hypothetical protein